MARDRQTAPTLAGIDPGHLYRYIFAKSMARGDVLDCACGVGYGAWIMASDDSCHVTAVDISQDAIDYARQHYPYPHIQWVVGDCMDKPWGEEKFDLILSLETIEHLSEPQRLLKHFYDSAKPGCKLIASTPNQEQYPFDRERYKDDEYPHQRHYTPKQFEGLLYDAGWQVIHRGTQLNKSGVVVNGSGGMFLIYTCEAYER